MFSLRTVAAVLSAVQAAQAHLYITYPGWRGDNLVSNGTFNTDDYQPNLFPYGMQWMYPCGGLKVTSNRTYWPLQGGALNFQPGWFQGHQIALIYINIGLPDVYNREVGYNIPQNYSHNVIKPFQITGPNNVAYPGANICIPQVPMPANISLHEGMNITIQVVEAAQHGAALYNCADVTLTSNMSLVPPVTPDNCRNDTDQISFQQQYYTAQLSPGLSAASGLKAWSSGMTFLAAALAAVLLM